MRVLQAFFFSLFLPFISSHFLHVLLHRLRIRLREIIHNLQRRVPFVFAEQDESYLRSLDTSLVGIVASVYPRIEMARGVFARKRTV